MSQNKYKCSGKDESQHQPYQKKDVELCLEVEMDDEVREIITSPEKCTSTLLDVTVIKPIDLEHLYSSQKSTLSGEEVRKLLASMELEKQDKQKLIDKILSIDDSKSAGDYVKKKFVKKVSTVAKVEKQRISTTDDTNSDFTSSHKQKPSKRNEGNIRQIYTTPKTYNDIKSIFTCKNKNRHEQNGKSDKPCSCRNCAIVGVLTDSQKKPFITENMPDPTEFLLSNRKDVRRKKNVNFKDSTDEHLECELYFRHLSTKIRQLEERLALQEEKSVHRDYFKRIITKLVTHLGRFTGHETSQGRPKSRESSKEKPKSRDRYTDNKYFINSVMVEPNIEKPDVGSGELFPVKSQLNITQKAQQTSDRFWKWGEEILKPGIDIKKKIVLLLEETLNSLSRSKSIPSKLGDPRTVVRPHLEVPQKLSADVPERDVPTHKSYKTYHHHVSNSSNEPSLLKSKSNEKKTRKASHTKNDTLDGGVSVSYLNPRMRRWQEESQVSFKLDSSDVDSGKYQEGRRFSDSYKSLFKETLLKTKDSDKMRLWQSIWNQAKVNGQSKENKVTIQMPDRRNPRGSKTVEIQYTITEMEELLLGGSHNSYKPSFKSRNDRRK